MESMGKTLQNLFKSYCLQLLKLDLLMAGKNDLVAVEEAALKSMFTQKVRYKSSNIPHSNILCSKIPFSDILYNGLARLFRYDVQLYSPPRYGA